MITYNINKQTVMMLYDPGTAFSVIGGAQA